MKEIYINGVITSDETKPELMDSGEEELYSFNDLLAQLDGDTEGKIFIDSVGGMVEEGMKIYDFLKKGDFETVAINASSIASVIFLAGKKRAIRNGASMIIHNAWIKGEEIAEMNLNANTLEELREEFQKIDAEIIAIYKDVTGLSESKLLALMAAETDIAKDALDLGFATEVMEEEQPEMSFKNTKKNFIMYNQKSITMANEKQEERLNAIEKLMGKVVNFFKAKSMVETLEDGTELFVFSEDGEFVGKKAVIADGGEPTETLAPAGTHKLRDGREIVVGEGGVIEAVTEAPDPEDMEAKIAAMEEEKEEMAKAKEELENKLDAMAKAKEDKESEFKNKLDEISKELKAMKEQTIGNIDDEEETSMTTEDFAKLSTAEKFKLQLMNKAQ